MGRPQRWVVKLSKQEQACLLELVKKGTAPARTVNRARASVVRRGQNGLSMGGLAHVNVHDSQVSDSLFGIDVSNSAQASILNSEVSDNRLTGLAAIGSAQVEVWGSIFTGNGRSSICQLTGVIVNSCNGIEVAEQAQLKLIDVVVKDNADWGLAATLKQLCTLHSTNLDWR